MPRRNRRKKSTNPIYSGLANYGVLTAWASAVLITIVGIVMIVFGSIKVSKGSLDSTTGKVTEIFDQTVKIDYTVDNQQYSSPFPNKSYTLNENITVYYNPKNPIIAQLNPGKNTVGIILIVCGVIFPLLSWLWLYIVRRSKFAAAFFGFEELFDWYY